MPNAFATGRSPKHAAVAVTRGLWDRLEPHEVEGVLAHELSHIGNRDVLIMTVASFFAMLAGLLTRFGIYGGMFGGGRDRDSGGAPAWLIVLLVSIVTYFLSQILILAISRYREFAADRGAALITGAPENLMSALQKIASDMFRIPQSDLREVESMNAFFIIPTSVKGAAGRSSRRTRRSRSASLHSPRSRGRWASRSPKPHGLPLGLRDVLLVRRSSPVRRAIGCSRSRPRP